MDKQAGQDSMALLDAVAERLDHLKSWKVTYWAPLVLGIMMMGDSWDVVIMGYVMPSVRHEWGLSALQAGMILSSGFGGQLAGALIFGPLSERFGRLPMFNISVLLMSGLSIACTGVHTPTLFALLRFGEGLGFGGAAPVCASYVNELAPTASRGRYFSTFQFLMIAGFSLCAITSAFVVPRWGWRAMFILGAFPALLSPLVLWTLPESPRWLARLGRVEATNRSLVKLGAEPIPGGANLAPAAKIPRTPVGALLAPGIRSLTLLTCLLWLCTAMVSNAFSAWTPTLYVDVFHLTISQSLNFAAWIGVAYGCTPLVFAFILDRTGRRPAGIAIAAFTLFITSTLAILGHSHTTASIVLIGFGWVSSGSSFVLLWPYTGEIFSTTVRATAMGLCSAIARIGSMLTPLVVAGVLTATGSIGAVFAALAVPTFVVLMLWLFTAREMARRRLDALEESAA